MSILIAVALAVVTIILFLGIWNMAKGGSPNRSQTFMRFRVLAQFVVIILVMITLYFYSR